MLFAVTALLDAALFDAVLLDAALLDTELLDTMPSSMEQQRCS